VPSENLEVVRRLYEAWNRGDTELAPELAADVEWVNPPEAVEGGTRKGADEFRTAMNMVRDMFSEMQIEVNEVIESGDRVGVVVTAKIRGRASGIEGPNPMSHIWTIRDGKAVRFQWFRDPAQAERELLGG
jgi:uncharacterized protein